jgi:thioredoxin-related protein
MKTSALIAAALLGLLLIPPAPGWSAAGVDWQGLEAGLAAGRNQNRKILLYFYADWCGYCKEMDQKTFSDPAVIRYLNHHFVPVRVNADRDAAAASRYGVRALPLTWFMGADGTRLSSLPGYVPAERLLLLLRFVHSESFKHMSLKDFARQSGGG